MNAGVRAQALSGIRPARCFIPPAYFGVEDINGEPPARDPEDGRLVEETGEALGVQGGAGHQHLQVCPEPGDVFDETKEDVGVERSLVRLVYDDHTGEGDTHTQTHRRWRSSTNNGEGGGRSPQALTCSWPGRAR